MVNPLYTQFGMVATFYSGLIQFYSSGDILSIRVGPQHFLIGTQRIPR